MKGKDPKSAFCLYVIKQGKFFTYVVAPVDGTVVRAGHAAACSRARTLGGLTRDTLQVCDAIEGVASLSHTPSGQETGESGRSVVGDAGSGAAVDGAVDLGTGAGVDGRDLGQDVLDGSSDGDVVGNSSVVDLGGPSDGNDAVVVVAGLDDLDVGKSGGGGLGEGQGETAHDGDDGAEELHLCVCRVACESIKGDDERFAVGEW